ncbi:MAG: DMT family transporter [Gammaproteobacteria bacterium]|nr:DMT family transporter [Gammaproteobacteria bacterium]
MLWLISSFTSALVFGFSGFLLKVGCERGHKSHALLFGMYITGTLLFALSLILQQYWQLSVIVIVSSILVGIGSAVGNDYTVRALETGPASITSPLINLNIILIVIMSMLLFGETLKSTEIIAIGLFIISCALLSLDPREALGIKDQRWYGFILLAIIFIFLRNGGLKVTQEIGLNNTLVLFYAYLFSLLLFAGKFIPKGRLNIDKNNKNAVYLGGAAGIFSYGGLELYAYSLQIGPASVVASIFSLRSMVMVVMAVLIYKETLTFYQKLSILAILTGTIIISL